MTARPMRPMSALYAERQVDKQNVKWVPKVSAIQVLRNDAKLRHRSERKAVYSRSRARRRSETYTAWDDIVRGLSWAVRDEIRLCAVEEILATAQEQKAEERGERWLKRGKRLR